MSVRGFSKTDGKELLYLEPFWWRNQEFTENPRVKKVVEGVFVDYEANLSEEGLRQMHEHFKHYADDDWYKTEGWQELIKQRMAALEWATGEGAGEFSHFIAGLYDFSFQFVLLTGIFEI